MTFLLFFITAVLSATCFKNRTWFERLAWIPYRAVHKREWYRAVSYGFVHGDILHLAVNMFVFLSFGQYLERMFTAFQHAGTISNAALTYGLLYFGGLAVSAVPDIVRRKNDPHYIAIGASGAVSAIVFTSIFLNPWNKIYFFGIIPIPGIVFGILYLIYEQYMGRRKQDRINHNAHLRGAIFGFVFPILADPSLWNVFIRNLVHG